MFETMLLCMIDRTKSFPKALIQTSFTKFGYRFCVHKVCIQGKNGAYTFGTTLKISEFRTGTAITSEEYETIDITVMKAKNFLEDIGEINVNKHIKLWIHKHGVLNNRFYKRRK